MDAKTTSNQNIEITVMAMRERLMEYFKGTCVERMTDSPNIRVHAVRHDFRGVFRNERIAKERDLESILFLNGTPFATLGLSPARVEFILPVANRSKQFREIKSQLRTFTNEYLPSLEVKEVNRGISCNLI